MANIVRIISVFLVLSNSKVLSELKVPKLTITEKGTLNTESYAAYFEDAFGPISPFHDIPLYADEDNMIFNMVVEIPRWTNAKMEINTKLPLNPIKQDVKHGHIRFVDNMFPYHGYIWNYGALPQTWENSEEDDPKTGLKGDNDPIDVCEIGSRVAKTGDVIQIKVLGVVALLDEGETDWKLITIDINDELAPKMKDIADVDEYMPGLLNDTVDWFTYYKVPAGEKKNVIAYNGVPKGRDFAHEVLLDTAQQWEKLVKGEIDPRGLVIKAVVVADAFQKLSDGDAKEIVDEAPQHTKPAPRDPEADKWYYVPRADSESEN